MKFMVMHKMTEEMEKDLPPDPEVMAGVEKLIADAAKENIFLGGEGLKPTSQRTHIVYKNGTRTATDGPFTETKDLIAGFALMAVRSREEAIAWTDRFAAAMGGDVEIFIGPIVEYWDLGFGQKPEGAPLRFLATHKMNERAENDLPPDPKHVAAIGALIEEMTKAGVLQATAGLASTKKGARIRFDNGKHTVIDGPFAESKELIAGYAIFDLPSKEEAIQWSVRFGEIVKVQEVDVRLMC